MRKKGGVDGKMANAWLLPCIEEIDVLLSFNLAAERIGVIQPNRRGVDNILYLFVMHQYIGAVNTLAPM